ILVGYYMAQSAKEVEWENFTEAFPAFLTMVLIPLTFSISDGLIAGFAAYGFLRLLDRLLNG
ncbi:MAG: NCS2 family permease, partial [Thermotogae bacterium]|nr:NCS2 family permease [Thermotogota bacterium]